MGKHKQVLLFIFFSFFITKVSTQEVDFHGYSGYENQNMSSILVKSICQDSNGFIWVATEYGLNKFDGINFTHYLHDTKDSLSISDNNVHKLIMDKNQRLWICYINGLQWYDSQEDNFRQIHFPGNIKPLVTDVCELQSGVLWIATSGKGLYELKEGHREARPLKELNDSLGNRLISCIHEDKKGNIWIGTINNSSGEKGLMRTTTTAKEMEAFTLPDVSNNNINAIVSDDDGYLYIGTSNVLVMYDDNTNQFTRIPCENNQRISVKSMIVHKDGSIFVGTEGQGLKYLDTSVKQLFPVENDQVSFDFNKVRVYALLEDRDGDLWLGCFQKGLLRISNQPSQFNSWKIHQTEGAVTSIFKDYRGSVWCSVFDEGVFQLNDKGVVEQHFPQPQTAVHLFEDSERTLWVSSYDKALLAKMNKSTGELHYIPVPQKGYIKMIVEDRHKRLYMSTFGSGIIRYNLATKQWEQLKNEGNSNNSRWVNVLLCDSKGLIWLGHYHGISCYNPEQDSFLHESFMDELSEQIGLSLMEDRSGNIWLGTYNGVFRIDHHKKEVRNYTIADGLSNNVVCGLIEDENGDVWCSTFKGISHIKVKEDVIVNYHSGNGLSDWSYNRSVYFQDKQKVAYFGGNTGITSFSPKKIEKADYDNEILTTNLYIHNQPVNIHTTSGGKPVLDTVITAARTFHFSYEDNTFTFEFSTMDFKAPQNIYYRYRLKESNEEWNFTQPGVNRITYNHLPPGKYMLELQACKYGSFSPIKLLHIEISPPWYRSNFAYCGYFLLFVIVCLLTIALIIRKRKEAVSEAQLRFFIDISHEIRSPMTLIVNPLEKLLKENHDAATTKALKTMHHNTRRILGLINQLLDMRKIDKGQMLLKCSETDMVPFIRELMDVFEGQAAAKNIRFSFEYNMESLSIWIDRNQFDKVLMNVLSNAFKYTPENGEVIILLTTGIDDKSWSALHHYVEITVTDTGVGLKEDQIEKIFTRFYQGQSNLTFGDIGSGIGLNLSRNLVKLHQGTIVAKNRKETKGSCFTIRLPLGKGHIKKDNLDNTADNAYSRLIRNPEPVKKMEETEKRKVRTKTNYKILVVDDDAEVRELLQQELAINYKVIAACNGNEALQIALSKRLDLIISDVIMPEMDGFRLVKQLRSNGNVSHIPIILLSSKAEHEARIQGWDEGADAYLTKPFNMEELDTLVHNLIANRNMLKGKFSGAQDQEDRVKQIDFKSNNEMLMESIITVINNNLGNPKLNVDMLVSEIGISRVHLHRKMKEMTGIPTSDFIRNIRLKKAAELLREKKKNISQIAYAVGFSNQTHFSTAFRKFYGASPSEYIMREGK